jgi:hypothetical protein
VRVTRVRMARLGVIGCVRVVFVHGSPGSRRILARSLLNDLRTKR